MSYEEDTEQMPERVYVDPDIRFPECEKQYGCDVEYIRADIYDALTAERDALQEQLRVTLNREAEVCLRLDNRLNDLLYANERLREGHKMIIQHFGDTTNGHIAATISRAALAEDNDT